MNKSKKLADKSNEKSMADVEKKAEVVGCASNMKFQHDLKLYESLKMKTSSLLKCYESMLLIRRFEERAAYLYGVGKIAGFCHLYTGQEAVAVGVQHCLGKDDTMITSYRCHGPILASGADPNAIMGELMGKSNGCSKGKGGSMHMFDIKKGFFGGHGIVGAQVPIGTGIALSMRYKKKKAVSVVYMGDGAINQGQVHEAMNMAVLWNLPVLYIIENNEYAMGTSVCRASGLEKLHNRGLGHGINGESVNGMNLFSVISAVRKAVNHCMTNSCPFILEMRTYRYKGHSMSDPANYRTREEVECVKESQDSLESLKEYLLLYKHTSEDDLEKIDYSIKAIVKQAVNKSMDSPEPLPEELYTDVYKH